MLEKQIERSILDYLAWKNIFAFKVKDQVRMTRDGKPRRPDKYMIAGVSDIIVCHKGLTLFVEVKTVKGRQSVSQKKFEEFVKESGNHYFIVRGIYDMREVLREVF